MRAATHSLAGLAALAAAPLAAGALAVRPAWRVGLPERLGRLPRREPGAIWLHAASVGEALSALPLVDDLRARDRAVFVSTVTDAGRQAVRRRRAGLPCHLAPLDHPWCVARALDRVAPAALALVETELWPCWIAAAAARDIPVLVVSGRLSARSFPRYRRARWLLRRTLGRLAAVGARSDADAERFVALGADPRRVSVTGDLKVEADAAPPPLAPDLARALGEVPLLVAGSTHPGEERAALEALGAVRDAGLPAALLLAPRRPERWDEVERLARRAGRPVRRRTALGSAPLANGEVLLLDTLGELSSVYARASAAFVGGSLAPRGGHNPLEAARAAVPVLYGPHTGNVAHAVELLEACGAGRRVADGRELAAAFAEQVREAALGAPARATS